MLPKEVIFSYFPKNTRKRYISLLTTFSSLDEAWLAEKKEFTKTGWKKELIDEFFFWKQHFNTEKAETVLHQQDISYILENDPRYPNLLKNIYDPPFCLFLRGNLLKETTSLAVVGPRKNTPYGKRVTENFVETLVHSGLTITSGLAYGIDAIAHKTTLLLNGKTIAVLGGGVDKYHISPRNHTALAEEIISKGGAIISEFPPGTVPSRFTFPKRNRIVAGKTVGTLIIEAGEKSGALITAQCATDAHREVFVVPQNIYSPTAIGANKLIQSGAHLVTNPNQILEILGITTQDAQKKQQCGPPLSTQESEILKHLSNEPQHIDLLIIKSKKKSGEILSILTVLEMKGWVKNLGNMMYIQNQM